MRVYRLSKKKYANELSGIGAAKYGNRWNSKGLEMIYTAESRALALAEILVHINLAMLPSDFMMIEIDLPKGIKTQVVKKSDLDTRWNEHPPHYSTKEIGDSFIRACKSCILKVPSAVVPGDHNYLINPHHPDFNNITIFKTTPFPLDKRLF